jgi:hypothetical protein
MVPSHRKLEVDYSYYLGPDYQKQFREVRKAGILVSNHVSWMDAFVLYQNYALALSLDESFKAIPIMSRLSNLIDSIYIPRGKSEEKRKQALDSIVERQRQIEETGKFNQLLVFAEGGTTNGTGLLGFKKGAFVAERRVQPVVMLYDSKQTMSLAYDIIEMVPLILLHLSWCCFRIETLELPEFEPTEYLFETHSDKGKERWEVFAWAVRDAMLKHSGLEPCDYSLKAKFQYEGFMQMKKGVQSPYLESSADLETGHTRPSTEEKKQPGSDGLDILPEIVVDNESRKASEALPQ